MRSVCWLKGNLRVYDSRLLKEAVEWSKETYLVLNLSDSEEEFRNAFIYDYLQTLGTEVPITVTYGNDIEVLDFLFETLKPDLLLMAKPFSWTQQKQWQAIKMKCARNRVRCLEVFDNFLADFTQIPLRKRFSDFYRLWKDHLDPDFVNVEPGALKKLAKRLKEAEFRFPVPESIKSASRSPDIPTPLELLKRLENFDFSLYPVHRDRLDMCSTSMLSPIINNGIVSIREVYARTVEHPEFTRQLAWREYFYHLKNNFEFMNGLELDEKRRNIRWKNDEKATHAFFEARTGYPIVDAAIRQLKIQKWIPNRARMIVASFLTKDLLVDWRTGERFFSKHLLDYDEVLNVGNWQWAASVGTDRSPFRIFNPVLQAKKFDPQARYIKKFLPELKSVEPRVLQDPLKYRIPGYPLPVVDHRAAVKRARKAYAGMD